MANSPVYELLERNREIFENRNLIIAGDVLDPMILSLVKNSTHATVICDNYVVCKAMAAMIGQSLTSDFPQVITYKHVDLIFSDIESALPHIKMADTLMLLLSKAKQQTVKLINLLEAKLEKGAYIYTAGANDGGGKSADSLLKPLGATLKIDLARKCTLFKAIFENEVNTYSEPKDIDVTVGDISIKLHQDTAVFSQGKLDKGTEQLLSCLKKIVPQGKALDLGCGCGVVGIFLSKLGFKDVTSSDVSAAALHLTEKNTQLNNVSDVKTVAADMLSGLDKYDVIAVNPPFHVGISTTTAPTVNMIINAPEHLNKGGVLYMVANSHLGYGEILKQNFSSVEILNSSNTFTVYKAQNL